MDERFLTRVETRKEVWPEEAHGDTARGSNSDKWTDSIEDGGRSRHDPFILDPIAKPSSSVGFGNGIP